MGTCTDPTTLQQLSRCQGLVETLHTVCTTPHHWLLCHQKQPALAWQGRKSSEQYGQCPTAYWVRHVFLQLMQAGWAMKVHMHGTGRAPPR